MQRKISFSALWLLVAEELMVKFHILLILNVTSYKFDCLYEKFRRGAIITLPSALAVLILLNEIRQADVSTVTCQVSGVVSCSTFMPSLL